MYAPKVFPQVRLRWHRNESARRPQPRQRDRDKPADRRLGRQAPGCTEGVDAVAGELGRSDVIPEAAGRCHLDQQVLDQVMDMLLRSSEVRPPMQEWGEFRAGVLVGKAVVRDERVGLQDGFQPLASVASPIAEFPQLCKVRGDLPFVPGNQDRFDVSRMASRTAARCAWIVSSQSLGTPTVYAATLSGTV
jgi:hypothetical protein